MFLHLQDWWRRQNGSLNDSLFWTLQMSDILFHKIGNSKKKSKLTVKCALRLSSPEDFSSNISDKTLNYSHNYHICWHRTVETMIMSQVSGLYLVVHAQYRIQKLIDRYLSIIRKISVHKILILIEGQSSIHQDWILLSIIQLL